MMVTHKAGKVHVGLGWAVATSSDRTGEPLLHYAAPPEDAERKLIERFLALLFSERCCRSAFSQCVNLERFTGYLADGAYTALETLTRLQAAIDKAESFTVKSVAFANEHAFARVEQISSELPTPYQHLIQLTVANGKIVAYFGSLQS